MAVSPTVVSSGPANLFQTSSLVRISSVAFPQADPRSRSIVELDVTAPEPSLNAKRTSGSDYFLCVGYAAIAEIVVAMIAAGALLDSPYGTSRPNYKQHAHESIWGIVELVFAPGHWASDILDTSNQGTMVTCIRLVAMLAAPAVVWGTGLFALRAGFRRLERSDDRLDAHVSTVTNDSGGTD